MWIAVSLAGVLALQLWTCRGVFRLPYLDTRLHYNFDNADFSFRARCGNRNGDLRSQFGVTANEYSRWDERVGQPRYYTDHPFLIKALFQQFARLAGTEEWTSRAFYFVVSFGVAAGLYVVLLQATGSLAAAFAGAATLVSMPLFAVYQTCVKFETDGMLAGVWVFTALAAFLRKGTRSSLAVYGCLAAAAFLVHWTAALFVVLLGVWLLAGWGRRREANLRRALLVTALAGGLGLLLFAGLVSYIQRGWRPALAELTRSFVVRSEPIPFASWRARQGAYFTFNFTGLFLWTLLAVLLFFLARWLSPRSHRSEKTGSPRTLFPFVLASLAVAVIWLTVFRQGSFVHKYWQLWFCLPAAALVGAFFSSLRSHRARTVAAVAWGALLVFLLAASRLSYAAVLKEQLGIPEDIAFLVSLREDRFSRLVFVPVSETPLNSWFEGPLFEYYTDRAVARASSAQDLQPGDKVLLLKYKQRDAVVAGLAGWSHRTLANEKCGERFCAYDVVNP